MKNNVYYYVQVTVLWFCALVATAGAIWSSHLWAPFAVFFALTWVAWTLWGKSVIRSTSNQYQWAMFKAEQWLDNHAVHEANCKEHRGKGCSCGLVQVKDMVKRAI
jgi:hypothetical protein